MIKRATKKTVGKAVKRGTSVALTPAELEKYRTKLQMLRTRLLGEVSTLTAAALDETDGGALAAPLHPADIGSDAFEQEQTLSFVQNEQQTLNEIDNALHRLHNGLYGICETCGCRIPKARLNFLPFAVKCVKCVSGN